MQLSDTYCQFVHITQDDTGKRVSLVGCLGGLESPVAEGIAFESVIKNGKPIIRAVKNGYCVRLYSKGITYTSLGHFYWRRRTDCEKKFPHAPDRVVLPCIAYDSVQERHIFTDPEFTTVPRNHAVLTPILVGGKPTIQVSFIPEPE